MFSHELSLFYERDLTPLGLTVAEGTALLDDNFSEVFASSSVEAGKKLPQLLSSILTQLLPRASRALPAEGNMQPIECPPYRCTSSTAAL